MGIVISQPLDRLQATINRVVSSGGRLAVKYSSGQHWLEMTTYPAAFSISLWGHVHGSEIFKNYEFYIEERFDVHP